MTATPLIPPDVARLVIHLPSWVGDAVMATPVFRAARRACPGARIAGIMRPGIDALFAGSADLDDVLAVDDRGVRGLLATARALRRLKPDAGLLLPNSFRSARAMRLGGVPLRAGYARDGRSWLLTNPVSCDRSRRPVPASRSRW